MTRLYVELLQIQNRFLRLLGFFHHFINGSKAHTLGQAVLYAGGLSSVGDTTQAEVTHISDVGDIVDHKSLLLAEDVLSYLDTKLLCCKAVLLLAGNFASMAAGAIVDIDEHTKFFHLNFSLAFVILDPQVRIQVENSRVSDEST